MNLSLQFYEFILPMEYVGMVEVSTLGTLIL